MGHGSEVTSLLGSLKQYRAWDEEEEQIRQQMIRFVEENPDCFKRSLQEGHITGSAWILDWNYDSVLLTHHAKLHQWIQLGGHSDGNPDTLEVALREAREESGLVSIQAVHTRIFDIDIHPIPAKGSEPEHLHYDVRFLFRADKNEPLTVSSESKDLQWVPLDRVSDLNNSQSLARMVSKTKSLKT